MNFLSHYYFDRENQDAHTVIGTVLPDLVKNAHKDWNFYPQKSEDLFRDDPTLNAILTGWKRHLKVDILFHSSDFFNRHTANLKQVLLPILTDSPVRPSFLAHIGVELLLDHLLVSERKIAIDAFYDHLNNVDEQALIIFLEKCGASDTEQFFKFLNSFRASRYLLSYQKLENISYALQRICMRLWSHPFHEETVTQLTEKLTLYKKELEKDYLTIYEEIEWKLNDE
jgi:acyl carrier protein phosphodiesterase